MMPHLDIGPWPIEPFVQWLDFITVKGRLLIICLRQMDLAFCSCLSNYARVNRNADEIKEDLSQDCTNGIIAIISGSLAILSRKKNETKGMLIKNASAEIV